MKRGDIYYVDWPRVGRHPAVLLTRSDLVPFLRRVTYAMVTSTIRGSAAEVPVDEGNGLDHGSVVNCLELQTAPKPATADYVGELSPEQRFQLSAALRASLELE